MVPAPEFTARDMERPEDIRLLSNDLTTQSTGLAKWSPKLTKIMSSDDLLSRLRRMFASTAPNTERRISFTADSSGLFSGGGSNNGLTREIRPECLPFKQWAQAAQKESIETVADLQGWTADKKARLTSSIEFAYTSPSYKPHPFDDQWGRYQPPGFMQFTMADVPGLVVENTASKTASRVPVAKNAWNVLKGSPRRKIPQMPEGPSWVSEFGPEMAKQGRVSVTITVYNYGV